MSMASCVTRTQAMPKRKHWRMFLALRCGMPSVADMQTFNGVIAALPILCVRLRIYTGDFADVAASAGATAADAAAAAACVASTYARSFLGLGDARVLCWIERGSKPRVINRRWERYWQFSLRIYQSRDGFGSCNASSLPWHELVQYRCHVV